MFHFWWSILYFCWFKLNPCFCNIAGSYCIHLKCKIITFRKPKIEEDEDDLFAGLGGLNDSKKTNKDDFMTSLFGGQKQNGQKPKEFVLDDKYKRSGPAASEATPAEAKQPPQPARSRRGTPYTIPNPAETTSSLNPLSLETADPLQQQQPRKSSEVTWLSQPPSQQPLDDSKVVVNHDGLRKQIQQLDEFEKDQQARFIREIEEHR